MCDNKKYAASCVQKFNQFSVWWMTMDKRRPVVIISNTWYNTYAQGVLVASLSTSQAYEKNSEKQYAKLIIPIVSTTYQLSIIKLTDLKFIPFTELMNMSNYDYLGQVTDKLVQKKIVEIMSNIFNPDYMSYFNTTDFLLNNMIDNNDNQDNSLCSDEEQESADTRLFNNPRIVDNERRVLDLKNKTTGFNNKPSINNPLIVVKNTNKSYNNQNNETTKTIRDIINNKSYDQQLAIDFIRTRGIVDDNELILNCIAYITVTKFNEISKIVKVTPSTISAKVNKIIKYAETHKYLTSEEVLFVKNSIRSRA